jgi:hypothetical protein
MLSDFKHYRRELFQQSSLLKSTKLSSMPTWRCVKKHAQDAGIAIGNAGNFITNPDKQTMTGTATLTP